VENLHVLDFPRLLQSLDDRAPGEIARIAFRRHHDRERRLVVPAQIEILEHSVAARQQRRHQVRHQAQHQHLTLRIAEAHVVFDQLRALRGEHEAGIENAHVRRAARRHGCDRRSDDSRQRLFHNFRRQQ